MAEALHAKADLKELLKDAALFKEAAYIGGEWVTGGATLAVKNPANGGLGGNVPDGGAGGGRPAIGAGNTALPPARAPPAGKRNALLPAGVHRTTQRPADPGTHLTAAH